MKLQPSDLQAIHELLSRYGHVIDERRWAQLDELFTDDAVFDASDFGAPVTGSLTELRTMWSADDEQHPLAHHATNILVTEDADGTVHAVSKGLGVLRNGRVASVTYRDDLRWTDSGWRLARRVAVLRRP